MAIIAEIQKLQSQIPQNRNSAETCIDLEIKINDIARKIMSMPKESRDAALAELLSTRTQLISHVPANGIKDTAIFFNLVQPRTVPTPNCPAYRKMRFPTISNYHNIAGNIACIRLDPTALKYVPQEVLDKVDLTNKQLDLFWTAVDGRIISLEKPINLNTHCWSHPDILPGWDVQYDVNMGIFPEIGFEKINDGASIAVNAIAPMNVHSHDDGLKPHMQLYSPDNAHFKGIPDSPFGVMWAVTQKDQRIAITKMLVIFDYDHPICKTLLKSIKNCPTLSIHLERLQLVEESIDSYFKPFCGRFTANDQNAMEVFKKLPPAFQSGVYREAWRLFRSPVGIHDDFGKASFENLPSLEAKYRCNAAQREQAIEQFVLRLKDLLFSSQCDLLVKSQTLIKGDNVLKMMKCAQGFLCTKTEEAKKLFDQLSAEEQKDSHGAYWELNGCPRGDDQFGSNPFLNAAAASLFTSWSLGDAVLLAASRQPHRFDTPVETFKVEELKENGLSNNNNNIQLPSPAVIPPTLTPQQIQEELTNLAFDGTFHTLPNSVKATRVNAIFSAHLSPELREKIYKWTYENSNDPQKGGENWGGKHVADDLDLLLSFQEALN
jgi:hypothetical protein